jgi:hypothetical protein
MKISGTDRELLNLVIQCESMNDALIQILETAPNDWDNLVSIEEMSNIWKQMSRMILDAVREGLS